VQRLEMGVVRQNRSVILHKWGSLWRSNFEGPDVGEVQQPFWW
jgi:hypothetical protein